MYTKARIERKNKLHIALYFIKKFNRFIKKPKHHCKKQDQTYKHHIDSIKVNRVSSTYDTISRLKPACSRFLNVFLEIVIFKIFYSPPIGQKEAHSENKTFKTLTNKNL
ncbi:hypothetical protein B0A69_02415 [Chryseobacterium shigense]|uniref:Uncharacterized protein n=1 Tax=Chryseobacterium shigense TaxID=297244 RepID=A0A1N7I900_9FLAO|nr:hypothetical protein B0A69_02415 [Chryseobacterium shigense]SIS33490.1 hypothetical protein SAMN05421639_102648 [Chryseobacterium shigense]